MTDINRITVPFCGSCGHDVGGARGNANDDIFCDACGADLNRFGFAELYPPEDLAAVGGSLSVTFSWTAAIDTQDLLYQINDGDAILISPATTPEVVAALEGDKVAGAIRTVLNGVAGPFTTIVAATATA